MLTPSQIVNKLEDESVMKTESIAKVILDEAGKVFGVNLRESSEGLTDTEIFEEKKFSVKGS